MRNPEKFNNEDKRAEQEYKADLGVAEKARIARRDALYDILIDPSVSNIMEIPPDAKLQDLITAAREHTPGDGLPEKEYNLKLIKELIREGERLEGRDQAA